MSEEANVSVEEELEAVAQPTEATEHNDGSNEAQQSQQKKRNDAEFNFAELRRQRERDREELAQLKAELNHLRPPSPQKEDDYGVNDDDLIEGKHFKNLYREINQLKKELKQKESSNVDKMIHLNFPDYADVVNQENLELLEKTDPELAESLLYYPDEYKKRAAAYKLIKKALGNSVPQNDNSSDRRKASENTQKPISVNAVNRGTSSITDLNAFAQMDPDAKKQFLKSKYAEMQQAIKGS